MASEPTYVREVVMVYKRGKGFGAPKKLSSSTEATPFLRKLLPDGPNERFVAIGVDARNQPIAWQTIGVGGASYYMIESSSIARFAILAGATRILVSHNHPSGDSSPSPDDVALTEQIQKVLELVGIPLLDHIILGRYEAFSFLDAGILVKK